MKDKTIKQLQDEFDIVVDWFSSEQPDIDKAINMYEKAKKLAKEIKLRLQKAENKIIKINTDFESK